MKVIVDFDSCAAHGDCVTAAPDLFDLGDDDEVVRVLQEDPPDSLFDQAEAAADACPMFAITVET